jgi:hypothetical protein
VFVLEPIGNRSILTVDVEGHHIRLIVPNDFHKDMDSTIYVKVDLTDTIFFDGETSDFLIRHNQTKLVKGGK